MKAMFLVTLMIYTPVIVAKERLGIESIHCSIAAASRYEIPANALLAVAEKEAGKPGQWVLNSNGTHDVGALQFNTAYLKTLRAYGIEPKDVAANGCYPYELAAWRLRKHIRNDKGDLWTKVANYHSYTPIHNNAYRADLVKRAAYWAQWLLQSAELKNGLPKKIEMAQTEQSPTLNNQLSQTVSLPTYVPRKILAAKN